MNKISIHNVYDSTRITKFDSIIFPGGEPHISNLDLSGIRDQYIWIDARISNSEGFITLLALIDAIKAERPSRLGLFLPYFPGARQDRRESGGTFTAKMYANLINAQNLDLVVSIDPHSDVLAALVNNFKPIKMSEILAYNNSCFEDKFILNDGFYDGIISPDAGSEKKIFDTAQVLGIGTIIRGSKHRDVKTGKLSKFSIDNIPTEGRYIILDDICDGGGTFIGLAQEIKRCFPNVILDLYTTHGIYSKGLYELGMCFGKIISTDSFPNKIYGDNENIAILDNISVENNQYYNIPIHELGANVMKYWISR